MKRNKRRWIVLALALALVLGMGATAFAATTADTLSEAQKEKLYALHEEQSALQQKRIDTYLELGLITEDQAAAMKERMAERDAYIKENGILPGGFGNGGPGRGGFGGRGACGGCGGGFGGGFGNGFGNGTL